GRASPGGVLRSRRARRRGGARRPRRRSRLPARGHRRERAAAARAAVVVHARAARRRRAVTTVRSWLAEPLPRAVAQAIDRVAAAPGVRRLAVMPDVHLAEDVCVGLVAGTDGPIYPQAVGGDIGCGMAALRLHGGASLDERAAARRG